MVKFRAKYLAQKYCGGGLGIRSRSDFYEEVAPEN